MQGGLLLSDNEIAPVLDGEGGSDFELAEIGRGAALNQFERRWV